MNEEEEIEQTGARENEFEESKNYYDSEENSIGIDEENIDC